MSPAVPSGFVPSEDYTFCHIIIIIIITTIGGGTVSVLASGVVDRKFDASSPRRVKRKIIQLVFVASPLTTGIIQEKEQTPAGSESGQCIRVGRQATCLSADCCFSELAL
jgi:hypothetical protein